MLMLHRFEFEHREAKVVSFVRPLPSAGVVAMAGYHSPQVEVDVRLNTNESPLPPPDDFVNEVASALKNQVWHRYPDRLAKELRQAIGEAHGLGPGSVFPANGSNEVLQSLHLAYGGYGRTTAVFDPTYAMYSQIASTTGTGLVRCPRGADHLLIRENSLRLLEDKRPDLVVLCSPNNPTGTVDPLDLVAEVVDVAASYGGLVVVDEAYGQFATESAISLLADDRPLVVSRTFSKTWAMAGVRLGYLLAPAWCVEDLDRVALPYHLDSLKQKIGVIALRHAGAMAERVSILIAERKRLLAGLARLPVTTWPSEANFVLFRTESRPSSEVWQALLDRSVLVRDFTDLPGTEGCLRVTVGTPDENNCFLEALREALDENSPTEGD